MQDKNSFKSISTNTWNQHQRNVSNAFSGTPSSVPNPRFSSLEVTRGSNQGSNYETNVGNLISCIASAAARHQAALVQAASVNALQRSLLAARSEHMGDLASLVTESQMMQRNNASLTAPSSCGLGLLQQAQGLSSAEEGLCSSMKQISETTAGSCSSSSSSLSGSSANPLAKAKRQLVREEMVEQAYKSKPQPGKLRQDLTRTERVALLRRRNREHARCARMRKKARHQELLDAEDLLAQRNASDNLQECRRETIQTFVGIRNEMLMMFLDGKKKSCTPPTETPIHDSLEHTPSTSEDETHIISSLNKVVENLEDFQFKDHDDGALPKPSSPVMPKKKRRIQESQPSALMHMRILDKNLVERSSLTLAGATSASSSSYQIVGGTDGIALNNMDSAMVRVEVTLRDRDHDGDDQPFIKVLGWLVADFVPNSSLLSSVEWTTLSIKATCHS